MIINQGTKWHEMVTNYLKGIFNRRDKFKRQNFVKFVINELLFAQRLIKLFRISNPRGTNCQDRRK